jgi:hypothetical protein
MIIVGLICVAIVGCGGPSKQQIEQAVRESLEQRVPASLSRTLAGGESPIIERVAVVQIGKAQDQGSNKYWPVKIYAKGSCTVLFGGRRGFEGETEYNVSKDPYGKWVATISGI